MPFADCVKHNDIRNWLNPDESEDRLDKFINYRHKATCEWIFGDSVFQEWISEKSTTPRPMWIHAGPGRGKSILAATIVERMMKNRDPSSHIGYFFISRQAVEPSPTKAFQSLIWQITLRRDFSPTQKEQILRLWRQSSKTGLVQNLAKNSRTIEPDDREDEVHFRNLYKQMLGHYKHVVLILDGLDECEAPSRLLEYLLDLPGHKLIVSQYTDDIASTFAETQAPRLLNMTSDRVKNDISAFIKAKLQTLKPRIEYNLELELQDHLLQKADGMFLWARLAMSTVKHARSVYTEDVPEFLEEVHRLPGTLENIYRYLLMRMFQAKCDISGSLENGRRQSMARIFLWALWSERALSVSELYVAQDFQLRLSQGSFLTSATLPDIYKEASERLKAVERFRSVTLSLCEPLITVDDGENVTLTHSTLRDFWKTIGESDELPICIKQVANVQFVQWTITRTCLEYLSAADFVDFIANFEDGLTRIYKDVHLPEKLFKNGDLLPYAIIFWPDHFIQCNKDDPNHTIRKLAKTFLESNQAVTWLEVYQRQPHITMGHLQLLQARIGECQRTNRDSEENSAFVGFIISVFVRAMKSRIAHQGQEHPSTLISMNNLASTYRNQGRWKEAEELDVQIMETRKRVLGQEHPDTLTSMSNLARVLSGQGKYEAAEEMQRRALELSEKVLGLEHPFTLASVSNLAWVFREQGKYKAAEEMQRRALELMEKVLGDEHLNTLASMNNLAMVLRDQGKYEAAEEMQRRVLELSEKVLGPEHPDTLASMNNLAMVLRDQGKYEAAEEMLRRVLELREKVLGPRHPTHAGEHEQPRAGARGSGQVRGG